MPECGTFVDRDDSSSTRILKAIVVALAAICMVSTCVVAILSFTVLRDSMCVRGIHYTYTCTCTYNVRTYTHVHD